MNFRYVPLHGASRQVGASTNQK